MSGGQDASLLNPIYDRKDYEAFSVVLQACMDAVMKLSNDDDECFGTAVFFVMILQRPSQRVSNALVRST